MDYFANSLIAAFQLIGSLDADIYQIVFTSVFISLVASAIAALLAVPAGVLMALHQFRGKQFTQHLLNTLMAMPTVVIGLLLYGLFSRLGPLGEWGLLYTPTAIIIAEAILIFTKIKNMFLKHCSSLRNEKTSKFFLSFFKHEHQLISTSRLFRNVMVRFLDSLWIFSVHSNS